MPILESQIDTLSDDYRRNRDKMLAAIAEFRAAEASVQATSEKSRARFAKRKQLMPRERMLAAITEFRAAEASVQAMAEKTRARFAKRKQLMPRGTR